MNHLNIQAQIRLLQLRQDELLAEAALSRRLREGRERAPEVPSPRESLLARLGFTERAPDARPVRA